MASPHLDPEPQPPRPPFTRSPVDRLLGWWESRPMGRMDSPPVLDVEPLAVVDETCWRRWRRWRRWRPSLGALALVAAFAGVGWWLLRPAPAPVEMLLPAASASAPAGSSGAATTLPGGSSPGSGDPGAGGSTTTTMAAPVVVQAAGAVARPGVHRLPAGARVDDLVRAAGGALPDADLDRVNLAAPLADGERIWVPRRGEVEVPDVVAGGGTGTGGGTAAAGTSSGTGSEGSADPAGPIDLNTATAADLDTLPGVGPATAAAILAHREANGLFVSVDDLLDVRGIGEAKLEQLRPLVTV